MQVIMHSAWWLHWMETFPCYWPFVRGIHRPPVNFPHKGQWRGALIFSLICAWINDWVTNLEAGDLRRHRAHHDATVMKWKYLQPKVIFPFHKQEDIHLPDVAGTSCLAEASRTCGKFAILCITIDLKRPLAASNHLLQRHNVFICA